MNTKPTLRGLRARLYAWAPVLVLTLAACHKK
jgi:hypothetical protein